VIERGESLDMWAKRINPDFTTILQVLTHVCTRLQLLHDNGLAHRDLKPGNILWRPKHLQWTLIDFGCAAAIGAHLSIFSVLLLSTSSNFPNCFRLLIWCHACT
jgi:serine/threonine protein kinase